MLVNASPYGNWVLLTFEVPCGARTLPAGIRANGFMTAVIDMSEDKPLLYHGKSDFNFPSGSNCGYQSKTSSFTRCHVVPNLFDCRSSVENKRRYFENSSCRIFPYRELANMNIKFLKITKTSLKVPQKYRNSSPYESCTVFQIKSSYGRMLRCCFCPFWSQTVVVTMKWMEKSCIKIQQK